MLGNNWRAARERELRALVLVRQLGPTSVPGGTDALALAMGFRCFCSGPCGRTLLRWPAVLAHRRTRRHNSTDPKVSCDKNEGEGCAYARAAAMYAGDPARKGHTWDETCAPFTTARLAENAADGKTVVRARGVMCRILSAMGLDPACATFDELVGCKAQFKRKAWAKGTARRSTCMGGRRR